MSHRSGSPTRRRGAVGNPPSALVGTDSMAAPSVCEAIDVTHFYGKTRALSDVSFSLTPGRITGLVGANGSGKSTLLRILAGVQRPTRGHVLQCGRDISASESVGVGVGAAIDGMALWPHWSARRTLSYIAALAGRTNRDVDRVVLDAQIDRPHQPLRTLSLGNRQRVALAAAMLLGTQLLLLDEPMNGLDPLATQAMRDLVLRLSGEGRTILLSSHDLNEVELLAPSLIALSHGRATFVGATSTFRNKTTMTLLRVSHDVESAPGLLIRAGVRCRIAPGGEVVVATHDARAAVEALGNAGLTAIASGERDATLEERFQDESV